MPRDDTYTVTVKFTTPTERDIATEFADAQQFERVGVDHYQVGYIVAAPTTAEAYRRTANTDTATSGPNLRPALLLSPAHR